MSALRGLQGRFLIVMGLVMTGALGLITINPRAITAICQRPMRILKMLTVLNAGGVDKDDSFDYITPPGTGFFYAPIAFLALSILHPDGYPRGSDNSRFFQTHIGRIAFGLACYL